MVTNRKYKGGQPRSDGPSGGIRLAGEVYQSLTGVAKAITGSHFNGYLFFRLNQKGGER